MANKKDEKLFLDVFQQPARVTKSAAPGKKR